MFPIVWRHHWDRVWAEAQAPTHMAIFQVEAHAPAQTLFLDYYPVSSLRYTLVHWCHSTDVRYRLFARTYHWLFTTSTLQDSQHGKAYE